MDEANLLPPFQKKKSEVVSVIMLPENTAHYPVVGFSYFSFIGKFQLAE
jgi:hypothetical protein